MLNPITIASIRRMTSKEWAKKISLPFKKLQKIPTFTFLSSPFEDTKRKVRKDVI